MGKMGFQHSWIRGTNATYQEATSQVLVEGEKGPRFTISRSDRQGYPLAIRLFFIFSEAMHLYLNRNLSRVHGMGSMGIAPILDYEFADDTALYVQGTESNLQGFMMI